MTRHLPTIARLLLGAIFFVFGLNGFLGFLPAPPLSPEAGSFMGALAATGYFFPLLKGTEVIAGALLLGNRFVPLALVVLAPIAVQITAFHAFLAGGLGLPIVILAAGIYLAYAHRESYRGVLAARAVPVATAGRRASSYARPAHA
jgi:uncharacterized membrane protein YphA (DoxX/SURF4 family)